MGNYLFLLLLLACPLMMVFMMRGMHGGHGGHGDTSSDGDHHGHGSAPQTSSLAALRSQRDELDRQIEEREAEDRTPVRIGWR